MPSARFKAVAAGVTFMGAVKCTGTVKTAKRSATSILHSDDKNVNASESCDKNGLLFSPFGASSDGKAALLAS